MDENSAFVSGALALVLRVSRIAGIAPLRFAKQRGGWRIRPSACFSVYGCLIITGINMATIATLVRDYAAGFEKAIRMQTPTRRVVWLLDACIVMTLAFLGAASGPSFMRTMINSLNQLQKVNNELNITQWPKRNEMKKSILFIVWIIYTILLTVADHALIGNLIMIKHQYYDSQAIQTHLLYALYLFYYFCYWIMQMQIFQFMYITLHIRQSFKAVNDKLKSLSQAMAGSGKVPPKFPINKATLNKKRKKSLNTVIDSLAFDGKVKPVDNQIFRPAHETVRSLAINYVTICDVVREVDQRYGLLLLVLLSSFMLHMILTPYYLINNAFSGTMENTLNIANQIMWCVFHTTKLFLLVEPCHLTMEEIYITRERISHLTRFISHQDEPMAIELDKFFKHILLNKVSFSPLKVTTLTRGLVVTILGSISTYLAIITQI